MESMNVKRGQIYYVRRGNQTGDEQIAGRPAVVVSNDINNASSHVVEVVYLTTQPKAKLPTHSELYSTGRSSTALCEQVSTVDKLRLETYIADATAEEMEGINRALSASLGLAPVVNASIPTSADVTQQLIQVTAERDIYKELYANLVDKWVNNAN